MIETPFFNRKINKPYNNKNTPHNLTQLKTIKIQIKNNKINSPDIRYFVHELNLKKRKNKNEYFK